MPRKPRTSPPSFTRTLKLNTGQLTVSLNVDVFTMTADERALVFQIVEEMNAFEALRKRIAKHDGRIDATGGETAPGPTDPLPVPHPLAPAKPKLRLTLSPVQPADRVGVELKPEPGDGVEETDPAR